jgi:hypothetical protein
VDGQGVHVGSQAHRRAVTFALERRYDAVFGDAGLDLQRQAVERSEDLLGGLLGIEAELGLAVDCRA